MNPRPSEHERSPSTAVSAADPRRPTTTTSANNSTKPAAPPDTSAAPSTAVSATAPPNAPAGTSTSTSQPGAASSPGASRAYTAVADLPTANTAPSASPARAATTPHRPGLATGLLAWFAERPPAAGSAVMATGIVSVGLRQVGAGVLSDVALALAGVLWLALAEDFGRRLLWQRQRWASESRTPAALTGVAATTVLGVRISLAGWQPVAVALLILATLLWPLLLWAVLRHLTPHMPGAVFLICVATQGMATLSATLAAALPARWLFWPALVLFVIGLGLYLYALGHFDGSAVRDDAGDHWVAGGALAISALACAKLTEAKSWTGSLHSTLQVTALVLIALAWLWYVVLAAAEVRWPRLRYDVRRWATIFPMGMTGAATSEVAKATGWSHLTGVGHTLVWIAAAAWLLVFIGLVRDVAGQMRRAEPAEPAEPADPGKPRKASGAARITDDP
ncbi:tellurite resistance protein TehA-like permease [Catenulispora sp. GAS73]|uniref:tellurite resistance/C4-dicarboxylate transporter family protein n=1 Tax=Catenulispora sp. GAS73 TaxID=3156269 RepID=UPI003518A11E